MRSIYLTGLLFFSATATAKPVPSQAALGLYVRAPLTWAVGGPGAVRIASHWASDEKTTGPERDVEVAVRLAGTGHKAELFSGRTDSDGLVEARFVTPSWPSGRYTLEVEGHARGKTTIETTAIELRSGEKLMLQSDKPIYQPSQPVRLRAVAVRPVDGKPVPGLPIRFLLSDPRGNIIARSDAKTSTFGIASAEFALADEILLGNYRATVSTTADGAAQSASLDLPVDRYRLPKLKVALDSDRRWYGPGQRAILNVDARYFFGKPVAGTVRIEPHIQVGRIGIKLARITAKLDADGKARVDIPLLTTMAPGAEGRVVFEATVTDTARQEQTARRELPYSDGSPRLEISTEANTLVQGVEQRVWVTAAKPDGSTLADTMVEFVGLEQPQTAKTNALGVATFVVRGRPFPTSDCPRNEVALLARIAGQDGSASTTRCVAAAPPGTLLVRPDHALYAPGAPIQIDIFGARPGPVLVDVVKDGQLVDVTAATAKDGVAALRLAADDRRFGTLQLLAYQIGPDGKKSTGTRLIWVERPSALRVEARWEAQRGETWAAQADGASFAPGSRGRLHVQVLDGKSGAGVAAQLSAVMVDESLLALRAAKPSVTRLFFQLAEQASRAGQNLKLKPGGYTMESTVNETVEPVLRDTAATILLAGALPPWDLGWQSDPWGERGQAYDQQLERLSTELRDWITKHPAGERVGKRWRWRRDLGSVMLADSRDARDPWGRRISGTVLVERAGLGDFDSWAHEQLDEQLRRIYITLRKEGVVGRLPFEPQADNRAKSRILTLADLETMVTAGKLPRQLLTDPWGQPLRVFRGKRTVWVAGLRSRYLVASAGPDGLFDTKDDSYAIDYFGGSDLKVALADIQIRGAAIGDAFGHGGLGLIGTGVGGGGMGYGTIGLGNIGTIGRGSGTGSGYGSGSGRLGGRSVGGGEEPRVRREFPETMLWRPDILTDTAGKATVDVDFADSITAWQLGLEAMSSDGRIGQLSQSVKVFQDFFVDLDLPAAITQHDALSVPVAVYNYLPTAQRITLELDSAAWFSHDSPKTETIELGPNAVGVRYFRIGARGVGAQKLLVRARGTSLSDAIERSIWVRPDGIEVGASFQDRMRGDHVTHELTIPADAIADASIATLKAYPSAATHVIEGLDSMLRMPGGCFEQTSSTTYPNALILDYLRKTGKSTPAVEKKATTYLAAGYQKLLAFEVKGGGFSWFGQAPANKILTAYGVLEFDDMAKVYPIDHAVIDRTQRWLASLQQPDGSWAPDTNFINEGATNHFNRDVTRITAYIAVALQRTGWRGATVEHAVAFVRRELERGTVNDAYTLALCAELLGQNATTAGAKTALEAVLDKLWDGRKEQATGQVAFAAADKTLTYGDGKSGTVETTARAATALMFGRDRGRVDRAIGYLLSSKDSFGNWYSTQATILSLKALLGAGERQRGRGRLTVTIDGVEAASLDVDLGDDLLSSASLPSLMRPGKHQIALGWTGKGPLDCQLVGHWFEPRRTQPAGDDLQISAKLNRSEVTSGSVLTEHVHVGLVAGKAAVDMPIVTVGVPPGFDVDDDELAKLVSDHRADKVQRDRDGLVLYLTRLESGKPFELDLPLKSRFPLRAQVPAPTVYEYYRPERRTTGAPLTVSVLAPKS